MKSEIVQTAIMVIVTSMMTRAMVKAGGNPIDYPFMYWASVFVILATIVLVSYIVGKKTMP